jgi:hypothetical protein
MTLVAVLRLIIYICCLCLKLLFAEHYKLLVLLQVYLILDEFILAGELQETSKKAIIERMGELERQE